MMIWPHLAMVSSFNLEYRGYVNKFITIMNIAYGTYFGPGTLKAMSRAMKYLELMATLALLKVEPLLDAVSSHVMVVLPLPSP